MSSEPISRPGDASAEYLGGSDTGVETISRANELTPINPIDEAERTGDVATAVYSREASIAEAQENLAEVIAVIENPPSVMRHRGVNPENTVEINPNFSTEQIGNRLEAARINVGKPA